MAGKSEDGGVCGLERESTRKIKQRQKKMRERENCSVVVEEVRE
jgi:hypothetical protein